MREFRDNLVGSKAMSEKVRTFLKLLGSAPSAESMSAETSHSLLWNLIVTSRIATRASTLGGPMDRAVWAASSPLPLSDDLL